MRLYIRMLFCAISFLPFIARAQEEQHSTLRYKMISTRIDTVKIDSLSLVPLSFHTSLDTSLYLLNESKSMLIWKKKISEDSVMIQYRVLPYDFHRKYYHKDASRYEKNVMMTPFYYDAVEANSHQPFIDFGDMNYSGSFGRNLSFGNSQDVVLNSQFNLQLEGDLGDSIKLSGAITDNTIPFQPDGTTQQIQEFDRVFIQLQRKKSKLIMGDYDINRPNSYFMNFYKRVQGGFVSHSVKTSPKGENMTSVGACIAKGKFVRNTLIALEGNQGPYKLTGPNGETFFIVLANSEKVFIDGLLLSRGEDRDYVIDYNTAEIIFMPQRLITKDARIVVEFEFTDRNYLNSLFYVNDEWKVNNKLQFSFNVYSNQDARNQPIQTTLDSAQKVLLSQIGDSIQNAIVPGVIKVDSFSSSKVLYKKVDTSVNSILYTSVYVYSTNKDSAKYQLSFNHVGIKRGNYVQAVTSANGRVYAWVAPVAGIPQGEYEPVTFIVTPKKQQLFTTGMQYHLDSAKSLKIELAGSDADPNLLSTINNETHKGYAGRIQYTEKRSLNSSKDLILNSSAYFEYVDQRFRPLERFRNVEFTRDWSLPQTTTILYTTEKLSSIYLSLKKSKWLMVDYGFRSYLRGSDYRGFQHQTTLQFDRSNFHALVKGDWMNQTSIISNSRFYRPRAEFEKIIPFHGKLAIGTSWMLEHDVKRDPRADTLLRDAFSFDIFRSYIRTDASKSNHFQLEYIQRRDRATSRNDFKLITNGQTLSLTSAITSLKNHDLRITGSYRQLQINDTNLTVLKPDETLLGRTEYNFILLKGLCSSNILYEFGAGQELRREFTYVEVPVGQGQYVWKDYNQDQIQQLNEFELANFPDEKRFVKIFTPTNQYVKAKYTTYNQSINIQPQNIIPQNKSMGLLRLLGLFQLQSAIQLSNRFIGSKGLAQYNPFVGNEFDSLLLQSTNSIINSLYINRMSNVWGLDLIRTNNGGKSLLNYGIDSRKTSENMIRGRVNMNRYITLSITGKKGLRNFGSQFLETRNYAIHYSAVEPNIAALMKRNQIRISGGYKYDIRKNEEIYGNEMAVSHSSNIEAKYNMVNSGSVNFRLTYASIQYQGLSNSTIGYAMLDGLLPGKNWLWRTSFDKRLSKNMEMSIEYEGRKSAENSVIHTGRASIRAVF